MSAVWHCLDVLGAEFCASGTCQCCDRHRSQRETLRLHEFLSRLRPEFEVVRSQLLTRRPRPPLDEAMPELRAEESRLREGGISGASQSSVLAVRAPLVPTTPRPSPPPLPSTTSTPPASGDLCGYCGKGRHPEVVCHKKQRDKLARHGGSSISSATRSVSAMEQELLTLLRHLTVVPPSPSSTTAQASGPSPPPPPSGISSKWFLDSDASFHMTPDSS